MNNCATRRPFLLRSHYSLFIISYSQLCCHRRRLLPPVRDAAWLRVGLNGEGVSEFDTPSLPFYFFNSIRIVIDLSSA